MTTGATSLLGLALPVEGELAGTWGDVVNDSITSLLDTAVAGTTTLSADEDVTLTTTTLASNQARQAVILWTASGSVTRNITAPASSKTYVVINATGGSQSIVIRGAGPTTGVTIAAAEKALVAWNGTDFVKISTSTAGSGTVTAVSVASANGFAGSSSGGATPALTLSTSITGVLKGNGTAISAAVAGTDYVTPTGVETLTNKTLTTPALTNPTVTNYVETVYSANSSTAITLDLANGTVQVITLTGSPTITMPTATAGKSFVILMKTGAGSFAVTWSTVKWPSDTAPTITTAASKMDKFVFTADGTNWYGSVAGQAYAV